MEFIPRTALLTVLAAAAFGAGALGAGCGGDDDGRRSSTTAGESGATHAESPAARTTGRGPIPNALRTAESAAEDTIDYALAGKRDKVVETANALKATADGPTGAALRAAGVSDTEIAEFRSRADEVAKLAETADLLRVALASNRAFGMVPGFFALYESPVPADVLELDYLDFEAKLRARAGHSAALRSAVARLDRTWAKLRADFVKAGGDLVAPKFDGHVEKLRQLAAGGDPARAEKEAQHGLDLVDELERVYAG